MKYKTCSKCKKKKYTSEFHKHIYSNDGYRSRCKKCRSIPRNPLIIDGKKKCPKCKNIKKLSEYYSDSNTGTGFSSRCMECVKGHVKKWREANPEISKAMTRKWAVENKDKKRESDKKYRQENKDKIRLKRNSNPEYKRKQRERDKAYRKKNKDAIKVNAARYRRERIKTDLEFKILSVFRNRVRHALNAKEGNRQKYHSTRELIGTSVDNLVKHLESLFLKGMTWSNHGIQGWHIDHIKPCAAFDLTDINQQQECFHYTNLQPLWAADNLKKGCKFNL